MIYMIYIDIYALLQQTAFSNGQTGVQFHFKSYQSLKKWYLIPLCLTLSIIRYISMVK